MKYLVLLVVLAVAVGIWRSRRPTVSGAAKTAPRTPALPQDMVACDHCGVHVPRVEALMLGQRAYCCAEHRRQHSA
ncbi:PP0621 family protein [Acidovorax carolinensis]|uniref:Uncharacterized protein n=1 Tax=Acidovorax carolinensis TaxID=553814 RepID=A0A240TNW7_9BURK|nr:PP0621 family protein [Acidovorax carolinensis]ART47319.1 hypothetical protein CBP33_03600 [Acidovorax carolinensis]ART55951.1 hypothetical protein CBP35_14920 [Acidovorax carolinensis]ART58141.1 hypothetical protein CBP36_04020 [Acidovorax carolinensis]